jgi:CRP-like cAMP-binding protein
LNVNRTNIPVSTLTAAVNESHTDLAELAPRQLMAIQLNKLPLLAGIDDATLAELATALQIRRAERGAAIVHKGGSGDHLLFLLSGRLQAVDLTEDGREIGLSFLTPGDYFGELSVIDGLPRSATVIACESSMYAMLPRAQALELMHQHPLVAERMFKRLAVGIRRGSNFRMILGIPNAFKRVYALLDYLAKPCAGGMVVIDRLPTQQEISIMVNTSRETVSRAMRVLIKRGVVEKDLRRLIIRQPDVLREEIFAPQIPDN